MTSRAMTGVALLAAAILAACSPSHVDNPTLTVPPSVSFTATAQTPVPTPPNPVPAPCRVITAGDVQRAFGGAVSGGVSSNGETGCHWTVSASNLHASGSVDLSYPPGQGRAAFDALRAATRDAVTVPELGDAAYFAASTSAVTVLAGQHQFVVRASFGQSSSVQSSGDVEADLIAIAQVAETHL